jgi:predicted O-linked N-acetylglucosamine transferase (SPINDLY family)
MGVPVVTFGADRVYSRHSTSHLTHADLADFIADSPEDYVERAVSVASDLSRLEERRTTLRDHVARSRLMNAPQYTKEFTAALREMWRHSCRNRPQPHTDEMSRPGSSSHTAR